MDIQPKNIFIGILVGMIVVLGGMSLITKVVTVNSGVMPSDEFKNINETLDKYAELNESISGMETTVTGAEASEGLFGVINGLIQSVWGTLKGMYSSLGFFSDMTGAFTTYLGIPSWVPAIIMMIIGVIVSFWIFEIVFKR